MTLKSNIIDPSFLIRELADERKAQFDQGARDFAARLQSTVKRVSRAKGCPSPSHEREDDRAG